MVIFDRKKDMIINVFIIFTKDKTNLFCTLKYVYVGIRALNICVNMTNSIDIKRIFKSN